MNDVSTTGSDGKFSFLYIPYNTVNLIGGRIEGAGTVMKSVGTFTVSNGDSDGQIDISIPNPSGGFFSDSDGILILTVSGTYDVNNNPVDGNVLSWTYDDVDEEFVVHGFDARDGGNGLPQHALDFVFAFVPYDNSLELPPQGTMISIN